MAACIPALEPPTRARACTCIVDHDVVGGAGSPFPEDQIARITGVRAGCGLIIAPVALLADQVGLAIEGPGEHGIHRLPRWQPQLGERPRGTLQLPVLEHPEERAWGHRAWVRARPLQATRVPGIPPLTPTVKEQDPAVGVAGIRRLHFLHSCGQSFPEAMQPCWPWGHQLSRGLDAPEPGP